MGFGEMIGTQGIQYTIHNIHNTTTKYTMSVVVGFKGYRLSEATAFWVSGRFFIYTALDIYIVLLWNELESDHMCVLSKGFFQLSTVLTPALKNDSLEGSVASHHKN